MESPLKKALKKAIIGQGLAVKTVDAGKSEIKIFYYRNLFSDTTKTIGLGRQRPSVSASGETNRIF
jgi:hypothetical protein